MVGVEEDSAAAVDPADRNVVDGVGTAGQNIKDNPDVAADDQAQGNPMPGATPFFSQVPSSPASTMPSEHQPHYGHRQENIPYTQGYLSSFNLGRMSAALPAQLPAMATAQWIPQLQQLQHDRQSGGGSQMRSSDHAYSPVQPVYYHDYGGGHGAPVSPSYMSPQNMQYQARYMPAQGSAQYMPNHQMQTYPYPQQAAPTYSSPGQVFFAPGQNQHFAANYTGPAQQMRPGQLGYPVSMSGISSRSNASEIAGASGGSRPEISVQTIPRGPPRKPRQSGHALWVGNLPPGATVIDLKDHFSREATKDIESLKLISKSNCAFVNYRTHAACAAAMERFHDSRFHGTKLVCRLRRTTPVSPSVPTQSDALSPIDGVGDKSRDVGPGEIGDSPAATAAMDNPPPAAEGLPERFFVMKSLTLQDLEVSTRTGMWATQAHNEERLNAAFESADNVYLFFSANKSGEYFGYARMASKVGAAAQAPNDSTGSSRSSSTNVHNSIGSMEAPPKAIPTSETEWAPKGRIIDDMARGTIFWEADLDDEELDGDTTSTPSPPSATTERQQPAIVSSAALTTSPVSRRSPILDSSPSEESPSSSTGRAFQVEWLSVKKLPFYKCRGLRNPWNANREVKIARDGTELETNVGKKLLMFFGSPGYALR